MNDLYDVGKTKSLGYLPIQTIERKGNSVEALMIYAEQNSIKTILLPSNECDIGSGALYFYDSEMLLSLLHENSDVLSRAGVPCNDEVEYIRWISNHTVFEEAYPEAYRAIGITFNDRRFR